MDFTLDKIGKRGYLFTVLLLIVSIHSYSQYSGLHFAGHEEILDLRTGLDLAPDKPLVVNHDLELSFDFFFQPNQGTYFGYIFRIISNQKNIDLIHIMSPDGPGNFQLVIGKEVSHIAFYIPPAILTSEWITFKIMLDFSNQILKCYVNDTILQDELIGWTSKNRFRVFFGANNSAHFSTTDVPSMNIRNICIHDKNKLKYHWPLNQLNDTLVQETEQGANGIVTNPIWLLRQHNQWNNALNLKITGRAQFTFDSKNDIVYIVSEDSLYRFFISDSSCKMSSYNDSYEVLSFTSLIFDTLNNQLISYAVDQNFKSVFDFEKLSWTLKPEKDSTLTEYWHHNRFISPEGIIYVFNGYGMHKYKNKVLHFNEKTGRWDSVNVHGSILPRYLAGAGFNPSDSLFYIIGGYGSESGEQVSNPDYYYDFHTYSFRDSTFRKVYEFKDITSGFCFSNSIFIDERSNSIYGFIYPKFHYKNKLQLVRISLDKPEIVKVGTCINYLFLDIKSYSDLYYSPHNNVLIAVTSFYNDNDNNTNLSIYTISFPPMQVPGETISPVNKSFSYFKFIIYPLLLILLLSFGYLFLIRRKLKKEPYSNNSGMKKVMPYFSDYKGEDLKIVKNSSIILFGGFQVIDREGSDITGHFSPLLKRLLLFILLNSIRNNKGVSSNKLVEIFWFEKSTASARNNRAVNIAKLRTILESIGKTDISKETGSWKLEFDPSQTNIDYYNYLQLVAKKTELTKEQIINLLSIIERGPFLLNTDADWLDPYKSEISNDIIDTLLGYIERNQDELDFIIHLTNCIFFFDSANEEAMSIKCRTLSKLGKHGLARQAFSSFIKEYELLYGEKYLKSFHEIIS